MFSIFTRTSTYVQCARGPWGAYLAGGVRESLGLCARVFLGRLTEDCRLHRLPLTSRTMGRLTRRECGKAADVLRADNGNASRLERRGTTGRAAAASAAAGRTLSGSMKFLLRRAATFPLVVVLECFASLFFSFPFLLADSCAATLFAFNDIWRSFDTEGPREFSFSSCTDE